LSYRFGFTNVARINAVNGVYRLFPDPDAIGVEITMGAFTNEGTYVRVMIDESPREQIYALKTDNRSHSTNFRKSINTILISFPRGSQTVTILAENLDEFEDENNTERLEFVGYRKLTSHIPLEKLLVTESAFKFYEIRPKQLFMELYGENYTVAGNAFEKLDSTPTFNGTWTSATNASAYGGRRNTTTTQNDFVDVTFTLDGDGGGLYIRSRTSTIAQKINLYAASGAVGNNNAANLIGTFNMSTSNEIKDVMMGLMGLPAGNVYAFAVVDTTDSEENAVVFSELTNNLRNTGIPLNRVMSSITRDCLDRVPGGSDQTDYNDGKAVVDYGANDTANFGNSDEAGGIHRPRYFGLDMMFTQSAGEFVGKFEFCEAMFLWVNVLDVAASSTDIIPEIDGRSDSTSSGRIDFKAGAGPTSINSHTATMRKHFRRKHSSDMSGSTTILVDDTRGVVVGQTVRVTADSQSDEFDRVASIVADTSITIAKGISGFANFTTANNATVHYAGFHRMRGENNTALDMTVTSWGHTPLPVIGADCFSEPAGSDMGEIAVSVQKAVANADDLAPPVFADGTPATWAETTVTIVRTSSTAMTWDLNHGFKNVVMTGGTTADFKLVAIRGRKAK